MEFERINELFEHDVTRDIPPVVYFHEQSPEKLADEVGEYIVTGGWPTDHPNHRRVPNGIHEQYVRLITRVAAELGKKGGPELPNAWISGFYGSGKSSFAKLLGLSLDGVVLPDGRPLAEAWLGRDRSPQSDELRAAWKRLMDLVDPLAVVFDVGGVARDNEHIHAAALRQVQQRLGYCSTQPLVADFELKLERDGEWKEFTKKAEEELGRPWEKVKDRQQAEDDFSLVMHRLKPEHYGDPMAWFDSRVGTHTRSESPEEVAKAIKDMLAFRRPEATLFLVIDEVSQYVLANRDRVDKLRVFASALGSTLKGRTWLFALGQQKLDEHADDSFLLWAKDRFPPKLRVHLSATNIRDVVHRRLLQKKSDAVRPLRDLFDKHRPDLKLYAYGCKEVTPDEFVDVYPMLPGYIDLLLQITSALRTRSARAQGDDQAIRGLLQLLGELFREQSLADLPVGSLVTLDQIYEVQQTALDSDVQASMARVLNKCAHEENPLLLRAAKAVALLELIQDTLPTDAQLVAQCLYDRVDRGNQVSAVTEALEELRRRNLLSYSEKLGYKLQSSAGEEWERERRDIGVPGTKIAEHVQEALKLLLDLERPRLQGRPFPWAAVFSDGRRPKEAVLVDPRQEAVIRADFRFLPSSEERRESSWINRSAEEALRDRLVWVSGDCEDLQHKARELGKSLAMVARYKPKRETLSPARKLLYQQEENRKEELERIVKAAVAATWQNGRLYFRGRSIQPTEHGASFAQALQVVGAQVLPELYPHFVPTQVQPSELLLLIGADLSGLPPKFYKDELGILDLDSGHHVAVCSGVVPRRVRDLIEDRGGVGGAELIGVFGRPPYGYTANVVKSCVAGLLRAGNLRIQSETGGEITAPRDTGTREIFERDRSFNNANLFPAGDDDIGFQARARICKFFSTRLHTENLEREDHAIADAAAQQFPGIAARLRAVQARLNQLPGSPDEPPELTRLGETLEQVIKTCRKTAPTVKLIKARLDVLRDGVARLDIYHSELTQSGVEAVKEAEEVLRYQGEQLLETEGLAKAVADAVKRIEDHLHSETPWREIKSLDADLKLVRETYVDARRHLLEAQEQRAEQARKRVMKRSGFEDLDPDASHRVLRPITTAKTATSDAAIAPALAELGDPFEVRLNRAEEQCNELLDELLSEGDQPLIRRVDLGLRNREVSSEEEVDALLAEVRRTLLEHLEAGVRVRIR